MKKLLLGLFLSLVIASNVYANWKFNPFTNRQDYYETGVNATDSANWNTSYNNFANKSLVLSVTDPITGGGDLTTGRTFGFNTTLKTKYDGYANGANITNLTWTKIDNIPANTTSDQSGNTTSSPSFLNLTVNNTILTPAGVNLQIANSTGTVNVVVNQTNGNVGIGTTVPAGILDVNGGSGSVYLRAARLYFGSTSAGYGVINRNAASNDLYFGETADTGKYIFRSSGATTIEGNVGIGTTNPVAKLHINKITGTAGTVHSSILLARESSSNAGAIWNTYGASTPDRMDFGIGYGFDAFTNPILTIAGASYGVPGTGNVGIGNTTPTDKLKVEGNISAGTNYFIGNGSLLTGITASGSNVSQDGAVAQNYFPMWNATGVIKNSTYSTTDAVNWNTAYNNYANKSDTSNTTQVLALANLTNYYTKTVADGRYAAIAVNVSSTAAVTADNITSWSATNVVKDGGKTVSSLLTSLTPWTSNINGATYILNNATVNGTRSMQVTFDGNNASILAGKTFFTRVPYNLTVTSWYVYSNKAGNVTCTVWKNATAIPTVADIISGTAIPNLASQQTNNTSTLTGWNTLWNSSDFVGFNVTGTPDINWTQVQINYFQRP